MPTKVESPGQGSQGYRWKFMIMNKLFWASSLKQFIKYGIVGIINTFITLTTIFIFMKIIGANYVIANVVGYTLGFLNSFILNKIWTFGSEGRVRKEIILFFLVFIVSYAVQLLFLLLIKEQLGISAEMSQIIAMGFYTIINFLGNKHFTFRQGV
jgi:putative flippase GtrA